MKLTVFFEDPFWVGIVEIDENGVVKAGRYVFGAEPSAQEIWEFVLFRLQEVTDGLSCGVAVPKPALRVSNPKRRAREAAGESRGRGSGTLSQEALRLELTKRKLESSRMNKARKEELAERKREIARKKAKDKHRGR
ncbi:Protein of unknown function [Paenibacillus sophorae]|uniref:YjdF family protein n=1 Tax=Paenibacillus sophorae TaxID=1333845 RepID=A0A1H8IEY4_9BACL|nr:YjdF family protein [Paenibacillus sophorae]QWU15945.1 YjdF family protein [Paenibacillus sophorae]SEN67074.1 Protein of unknown function [Paenibacillus sophorae]